MVRTVAPNLMPALAALAVLPLGCFGVGAVLVPRLLAFSRDEQGNIVEYNDRYAYGPNRYAHGWDDNSIRELLIRPAMEIAACSHAQAETAELRTRHTRLMGLGGWGPWVHRVEDDWYRAQGFTSWRALRDARGDPQWLPPPPMTPLEADAALSATIALPYLLASHIPEVRQWAVVNLASITKPRRR